MRGLEGPANRCIRSTAVLAFPDLWANPERQCENSYFVYASNEAFETLKCSPWIAAKAMCQSSEALRQWLPDHLDRVEADFRLTATIC
jgi:hypothetical protein